MTNEVFDVLITYLELCLKENHGLFSATEERAYRQAIEDLRALKIPDEWKYLK